LLFFFLSQKALIDRGASLQRQIIVYLSGPLILIPFPLLPFLNDKRRNLTLFSNARSPPSLPPPYICPLKIPALPNSEDIKVCRLPTHRRFSFFPLFLPRRTQSTPALLFLAVLLQTGRDSFPRPNRQLFRHGPDNPPFQLHGAISPSPLTVRTTNVFFYVFVFTKLSLFPC